jgi:hypothetical protein
MPSVPVPAVRVLAPDERAAAEGDGVIIQLWHGGVPGLRPGDLIQPGHARRAHDGCPWCEARAKGGVGPGGLDPLSGEQDRVYMTTHRLYAKHYASLWGRGDLYRVEPVGDATPSTEDSVPSFTAPAARVVAVYERAVLLTNTERRRLAREWAAFDAGVTR